jgi:hypothetical protein
MDPQLAWPMDQPKDQQKLLVDLNSRYVGSDDGWANGCANGNRLAEGSRVGFKVGEGDKVIVGGVKGWLLGVDEGLALTQLAWLMYQQKLSVDLKTVDTLGLTKFWILNG